MFARPTQFIDIGTIPYMALLLALLFIVAPLAELAVIVQVAGNVPGKSDERSATACGQRCAVAGPVDTANGRRLRRLHGGAPHSSALVA